MPRVDRLPTALQTEIQRLWELYRQDPDGKTFDEWIIASQTEPVKRATAAAAHAAFHPSTPNRSAMLQ